MIVYPPGRQTAIGDLLKLIQLKLANMDNARVRHCRIKIVYMKLAQG